MRYLLSFLVLLLLLTFSAVAFSSEEQCKEPCDNVPVITEITPIPAVEEASTFREGNLTCMEARAILQEVVGEYFDLDQELEEASLALAFMDEPTKLRARADFLEKVSAMGDRLSLSWIDCVKACPPEAKLVNK